MPTTFAHVNIIAEDWEKLVLFYEKALDCQRIGVVRDLQGEDMDRASGVRGAQFKGIHLRLPGTVSEVPTLEIYTYTSTIPDDPPPANRRGFAHIAFRVDDVDKALEKIIRFGGSKLGTPVSTEVQSAGRIRWVYARDPEGNIVELQKWE